MTTIFWPTCDCCGVTSEYRGVAVAWMKDGEVESYCTNCRGLLDSGLIRRERDGDDIVFRQYHPQPMIPGDIVSRRPRQKSTEGEAA